MTSLSATELLVLHAVRLKGFADDVAIAARFGLEVDLAAEFLLDSQAFGWVAWSEFAGSGGWSLTEAGRAENARQLAAELDQVGGRLAIQQAYAEFLPLNGRLQEACTQWQLRPTEDDALAFNDHTDADWDRRVVEELESLGQSLRGISHRVSAVLERLGGYDARFAAALRRVREGDGSWVDRTGADSCHTVWFELHEDLIATLGLTRGTH
ncbi:transcriptional regulator [Kribbella sp. NPDC051620]|uniref:transcriptional regulator n=1 Tax=Kribbella sp. NPDC051620 TaxID=3364120 RepID=UPI0037990206